MLIIGRYNIYRQIFGFLQISAFRYRQISVSADTKKSSIGRTLSAIYLVIRSILTQTYFINQMLQFKTNLKFGVGSAVDNDDFIWNYFKFAPKLKQKLNWHHIKKVDPKSAAKWKWKVKLTLYEIFWHQKPTKESLLIAKISIDVHFRKQWQLARQSRAGQQLELACSLPSFRRSVGLGRTIKPKSDRRTIAGAPATLPPPPPPSHISHAQLSQDLQPDRRPGWR